MASDELKNLQQRRAEQKALLDEMLKGKTDEERLTIKQDKIYKGILSKLREINEQVKEIQAENKIVVDNLISQESKLKGLTGIQASLVNLDRQRLTAQQTLDSTTQDAINSIASMNQELLSMSAEDAISRELQNESISKQIDILRESGQVGEDILTNLEQQRDVAHRMSGLTDNQQKLLNKQLEVYDGIKDTIGGILDTASLLTKGIRGGLGVALIGAGAAGKKLLDTSYKLGGSLLDTSNISTTLFGTVFEDAVETTKGLSKEFGGLSDVSLTTQLRTNVLAKNLGIGAGEAAKLTGSFARLNDGSAETAQNLIQSTQNLAIANGLVPADVMADVAASAEEFALYGKDGGKNIAEAAVAAGKLGVSMKTLSGITDNLLDFESSINAELELGAMLGRNINLDRARALAYEGDIGGAVRETLSSLGGIEEFNRMDYFQKKQTAALLGVSVEEFQKMADNADKLGKNGEIQVSQYESLFQNAKAFGSEILSAGQGLGGILIATGQIKDGIGGIGDMWGKVKGFFGMGKDVADTATSALGPLKKDGTPDMRFKANKSIVPDIPEAANPAKKGGLMDSMSKINMNDVLKGAAALVIVAGAVFVFGKAVQEFMKVSWGAVGMAVVSMFALVAAVLALGMIMTSGYGTVAIVSGAQAMLLIAASVLVLGYALQAIGTGFDMMANGIASLTPNILSITTAIGGLVVLMPAIVLLSYSIMGLSASLMALGLASLVALPALAAVGAVGGVVNAVNSIFGGGEEGGGGDSDLINEIRGLRADLNDGKVAVYMDGQKVTAAVSKVVSKVGSNSYAL